MSKKAPVIGKTGLLVAVRANLPGLWINPSRTFFEVEVSHQADRR